MEQEKELVVSQSEWLTQELNSRSEQLIQLRKERFTTIGELKSKLFSKDEEVIAGNGERERELRTCSLHPSVVLCYFLEFCTKSSL